jgi:RNA polymerase sigma-70 factor (ECF subfamily)
MARKGAIVQAFPLVDTAAVRARLMTHLRRRIADPSVAEDLAQEALIRMLAAHERVGASDPTALAVRIADHLLIDHFRRQARRPTDALSETLADAGPDPEQQLVARQRLQHFYAALMRLPPLRREVFVRRRVHGEPLDEIARDLGLSVAAAEKHISRALLFLAKSPGADDPQ